MCKGRYDIVCPPGTAWELYKVILTFNSPIKIKINKNTVSTSKRKIREGGNIETPSKTFNATYNNISVAS
jgi:hypothetical protein